MVQGILSASTIKYPIHDIYGGKIAAVGGAMFQEALFLRHAVNTSL
jgi:hypothetical protein